MAPHLSSLHPICMRTPEARSTHGHGFSPLPAFSFPFLLFFSPPSRPPAPCAEAAHSRSLSARSTSCQTAGSPPRRFFQTSFAGCFAFYFLFTLNKNCHNIRAVFLGFFAIQELVARQFLGHVTVHELVMVWPQFTD